MENVLSNKSLASTCSTPPESAKISGPGLISKTDPRSRKLNRSTQANAFETFAGHIRRDLNPRGSLEQLVVDHATRSAWRLQGSIERQTRREVEDEPTLDVPKRSRTSVDDRAIQTLREALDLLDHLRMRHRVDTPDIAVEVRPTVVEETPFASECPIEEPDSTIDPTHWRDRLIFDFDVSETSPVVKGTWITVSHVVSLIVDGWPWADILRSHPELSQDDIQTCVTYAMAEEHSR